MVIPERFQRRIDAHMLGNMLDIENYPLILAIIGKPGMGKTYQLRHYLVTVGVKVFSISAADLESDRAGEPAKLLKRKYLEASDCITDGNPSALLIDDVDTTLGEWKNYTGTVNHQDVLAVLMHLADSPCYIEDVGSTNRVPVFLTGNQFDRLYVPLVRTGRTIRYDWEPTRAEKIEIVNSIFNFSSKNISKRLVDAFPDAPVSFFSTLLAEKCTEMLTSLTSSTLIFKAVLTNKRYRSKLISDYNSIWSKMDRVSTLPHTGAAERGASD